MLMLFRNYSLLTLDYMQFEK